MNETEHDEMVSANESKSVHGFFFKMAFNKGNEMTNLLIFARRTRALGPFYHLTVRHPDSHLVVHRCPRLTNNHLRIAPTPLPNLPLYEITQKAIERRHVI